MQDVVEEGPAVRRADGNHALQPCRGGRRLTGIERRSAGAHARATSRREHERLHALTISSFGFVFHRPRVKSGMSTGRLRFATDCTVAPTRLLRAAAS